MKLPQVETPEEWMYLGTAYAVWLGSSRFCKIKDKCVGKLSC